MDMWPVIGKTEKDGVSTFLSPFMQKSSKICEIKQANGVNFFPFTKNNFSVENSFPLGYKNK